MKAFFTLLFTILINCVAGLAQLPDGTLVPDFTATDINGNTWNLYDLLDEGKTVVLDVSATWCGPCWSYHTSGALEELYTLYGPDGTDEMMVFMIEGDPSTNLDCLYDLPGCNSTTLGDWTDGIEYPIINNDTLADLLEINYYPTLYHICPSRYLTELPQTGAAEIYSMNASCPSILGENNASVVAYTGFSGDFCGDVSFSPSIKIQNLGNQSLTNATAEFLLNGMLEQTIEWTGNLETFGVADIVFETITISSDAAIQINITSVNNTTDDDNTNNMTSAQATASDIATDQNFLTLELKTDKYPTETYWEFRNSDGNVLYAGGNGTVAGGQSSIGAYTETNYVYTIEIPLPGDDCYNFKIYDAYGDGICCTEGDGYYKISDQLNNILQEGGAFGYEEVKYFSLLNADTIKNNAAITRYSGESGSFCFEYEYSPELIILNQGTQTITTATIEISNNEGVLATEEWIGNILSGRLGKITLSPLSINESTDLTFTIININDEPDTLNYQNSISTSFYNYYTESSQLELELQIHTYAYEIYWQFTDSEGTILASGGNELVGPNGGGLRVAKENDPGAYPNEQLVQETITIPSKSSDCYELLIVDDWGDGLVEGMGGYVKISDNEGNILFDRNLDNIRFIVDQTYVEGNTNTTATLNPEDLNKFNMYPNPANDKVYISSNAFMQGVEIRNSSNQVVYSFDPNADRCSIDISWLSSGIYFVTTLSDDCVTTKKLVVD